MSSIPRQLATFAAVLAVLYAGGIAAGHIIGDTEGGGHGGGAAMSEGSHSSSSEAKDGADAPSHGEPAGHGGDAEHGGEAAEVRGLSSSEGGLRLSVDASEVRAGRPHDLTFTVLGRDGAPVTEYDTTHTKKMHLIVVRRDTTGFQHLHPTLDEAGRWRARTRFAQGGSYRLFADFSHDGEQRTLADDLAVTGPARIRPLPQPTPLARTAGGYEVRIEGDEAEAGEPTTLSFVVRDENGRTVRPEPFLGARGHLVALREGNLAYLHVHPTEDAREAVSFETTFPNAATYRLFLQFKVAGRVQTAAFTRRVG